ncbi:5-carboxymethyl-2-hydroxymuconate Delta-isomerase [Lampropedia puyangensis]|uniref:5-carboxymethyl-2-hydroxymuconate Delta-isomerase n=1 Tax=Lampropedia puyangensis TaxID=1330072 RepID=A0A4S8FBP8_9BURK|nr:5-carboxymethyl-2-hydroxymuconate Delta-isomerase [Lampropedia puyangensis]THU04441.1 5-carboxymethyl-2-hydroxymuconate Delta-isomerase [Lampropedia puyangensis]
MPQVTLEYTANLPIQPAKLLTAVNAALFATGQFKLPQDIKSRARALEVFAVGDDLPNQAFVHLQIAVLDGRSIEVRRQIADAGLAALQQAMDWDALPLQVQLGAEVKEMTLATYARVKNTPQAAA